MIFFEKIMRANTFIQIFEVTIFVDFNPIEALNRKSSGVIQIEGKQPHKNFCNC